MYNHLKPTIATNHVSLSHDPFFRLKVNGFAQRAGDFSGPALIASLKNIRQNFRVSGATLWARDFHRL
jgi:hypothetical protein